MRSTAVVLGRRRAEERERRRMREKASVSDCLSAMVLVKLNPKGSTVYIGFRNGTNQLNY